MRESPVGLIIPYNKKIYRPWAEHIWRHYRAGEYVFVDTDEGAYVKDIDEARRIHWPDDAILSPNDVWCILFDRGTTFGCCN